MPPSTAWKPGQSGNPSGRPKSDVDLPAICRGHTLAAVNVLVECLQDPDKRISLAAARELLDRGHGRPVQPVAGEVNGQLNVTLLHLVAAREVSAQITALMGENREQAPPVIEGDASPVDLSSPALE